MTKATINRISLTEQIQSILIKRIIGGDLAPGDRLKELQIANEFGTSQAPVREAIRGLQALGYVEHKAHIGALVKIFSKKEIGEAFQIREALESHCLLKGSNETMQLKIKLTEGLINMKQALSTNNVQAFTNADNAFHRAILESCNNKQMLEIWDSLKMQLQIVATLTQTAMPLKELYDLHTPIVNSLETEDRGSACKELMNHYKTLVTYWKRSAEDA